MTVTPIRFTPTRRPSLVHHSAFVAAVMVGVVSLVGCEMETRVVSSSWDNLRSVADPPPQESSDGRRVRGQAFAVELKTFTGRDRLQQAFDFANVVRTEAQIADVWFADRGEDATVYAGRYPRKDHPEAKTKLKTVRQATLEGKRAFSKAKLVTIDRSQDGTRDQHDLSQYSGHRTLLLAVFDENFGKDFRRAAEDYADELREAHDVDVYYYHGPNQSLVTAGLFTQMDFVPVDGVDRYGPAIRQMQELFPHTQRNGQFLTSPDLTTPDQREPTIVVRVP